MRLGIISALAFFLLRKMVSLNSEAVRDPHSKSFNFCFVISECGLARSYPFFSNSRSFKLILIISSRNQMVKSLLVSLSLKNGHLEVKKGLYANVFWPVSNRMISFHQKGLLNLQIHSFKKQVAAQTSSSVLLILTSGNPLQLSSFHF